MVRAKAMIRAKAMVCVKAVVRAKDMVRDKPNCAMIWRIQNIEQEDAACAVYTSFRCVVVNDVFLQHCELLGFFMSGGNEKER